MAQRLALIIGNSEYDDPRLSRLKTPDVDVIALASILEAPKIGSFDEVVRLINKPTTVVRRAIAHFFARRKREDLLLLYFSGHGVLDEHGYLYLAVKDTEREFLGATAIPASFITNEMDHSRSRRQALILDCCHSGAFERTKHGVGTSVGTQTAFKGNGYGRVILTASDATQFAWEGDEAIGEVENSIFTHYLIRGLETGEADLDQDGWIGLDELYDYVYERVIDQALKQTPGKWSYRQQGNIVIARSKHPSVPLAKLPLELLQAVESPLAFVREGAVRELDRLLEAKDRLLSMAAREALEQLINDDSRRVSAAADQCLRKYNQAETATEPSFTRTDSDQMLVDQGQTQETAEKHEQIPWSPPSNTRGQLNSTVNVETVGGIATPLIYRSQQLPAQVTEVFSTAVDDQTRVDIHLLFGDNKMATDNISLGRFIFDGIDPAPKGVPQVRLQVDLDKDLKLRVMATNETTRISKQLGEVDLTGIEPPETVDPMPPIPDTSYKLSPFGNVKDIFEEFFGSGFKPSRSEMSISQGEDLYYDLTVTFEEATRGTEKDIKFRRPEICSTCKGTGVNFGLLSKECQTCRGQKIIQVDRLLRLKIPAGVDNNTQIRLTGEGGPGWKEGTPGNLYVVISVKEHDFFVRDEQRIILKLPIKREQARNGGKIEVPTVYGWSTLAIPPNSKHGNQLILSGMGVPDVRNPNAGHGDQIIQLLVIEQYPLSEKTKHLFEMTNKSYRRVGR